MTLESVDNLKRHRRQIEKEMAEIGNKVAEEGRGEEVLYQEARWEMMNIKTNMEEALWLYKQQL